jgi:hypothetical protein
VVEKTVLSLVTAEMPARAQSAPRIPKNGRGKLTVRDIQIAIDITISGKYCQETLVS